MLGCKDPPIFIAYFKVSLIFNRFVAMYGKYRLPAIYLTFRGLKRFSNGAVEWEPPPPKKKKLSTVYKTQNACDAYI